MILDFLNVLNVQGQFFNEKAREADEKSFQKLMETRLVQNLYFAFDFCLYIIR
jgi:hypothetical protein